MYKILHLCVLMLLSNNHNRANHQRPKQMQKNFCMAVVSFLLLK